MVRREGDLDRDVQADVEFAELGPDYARRVGEPIEGVRNRPAGPPESPTTTCCWASSTRTATGRASSSPRATPSRPVWPDFPAGQPGRPVRSRVACRGGTGTSGDGLRTASSSP